MSDRTYTPNGMADAVQRMIDDGTYMPWDVLPKLVEYLRTPPATGAAAMREAAAKVAETPYSDAVEAFGPDEPMAVGAKIAAAIRALPAPEVPGEVREWVRIHMGTSNGDSLHDRLERFVRDWIRKEYGL